MANGTSGIISPVNVVYDELGHPVPFSLDAFQRLRVSEPHTIFDSKQVFYDPSLYYTGANLADGYSEYHLDRASTMLHTTTTSGSGCIRQTKRYFNYQPGKSFQCFITFVATGGGVANTKKSIGYYDGYNGIFFSLNGTTPQFTIRSNVDGVITENTVVQNDWSVDKLNGTGSSGITANFSKAQILYIDFEWLGVGSVRVGFVVNGRVIICHQFNHANLISSVYMRSSNLPIRWEITGTGAASSLEAICCSVASEGGRQLIGLTRSVERGITTKTVATGTPEQLIAIRLKDGYRSTVIPTTISIAMTGTTVGNRWALHLNPTIAGTGSASWQDVPNSAIQYDVNGTASGSRTITAPGTIVASGCFANEASGISLPLDDVLTIASDYNGVSDILVLAAQPSTGSENYLASLSWKEPT